MESAFPGRYTGTGKRQKEAHYARKISRHRHRRIVRAAGCRAVERDTFYNELPDR